MKGFILICHTLLILSIPLLVQAQGEKKETLVGYWTFEPGEELKDLTGNFPDITLTGAKIAKGQLDLDAGKWAIATGKYTGPTIAEKTMVSWASLDDVNVRSGSILTIAFSILKCDT